MTGLIRRIGLVVGFGRTEVSRQGPSDAKRVVLWAGPEELKNASAWVVPNIPCVNCNRLDSKRGDASCFLAVLHRADPGAVWHAHPAHPSMSREELSRCERHWKRPKCRFSRDHLFSRKKHICPRLHMRPWWSESDYSWVVLADVLIVGAKETDAADTVTLIDSLKDSESRLRLIEETFTEMIVQSGMLDCQANKRLRSAQHYLTQCKSAGGALHCVALMGKDQDFLEGESPLGQALAKLKPTVHATVITQEEHVADLVPYLAKDNPVSQLASLFIQDLRRLEEFTG